MTNKEKDYITEIITTAKTIAFNNGMLVGIWIGGLCAYLTFFIAQWL